MRGVPLVVAFVLAGCLGSFPPDQTGTQNPAGGSSGNGGGGAIDNGGGGSGGGGSGGSVDAGVTTDAGTVALDMAGASGGGDMVTTCIKLTTPLTDGHHNAGQACLGCHNGGGAALFTVAGTLYNAATNGATIAGATIEVIDAKGTKVDIVTSSNGNFYTSTALTAPFTVRASGCPNDASMVSNAQGDCNTSGCHTSAMRVHLP